MIPYDDLVAALASWRQRQGLPVSPTAAAAAARSAPRATPPGPPPAAPQVIHDGLHHEEETQYDAEGDDYAIPLGDTAEPTSIGDAPKRNDW